MLADGDILTKIAELKERDEGLWEKIVEYITALVDKIKAVYKDLKPDSAEGKFVAEQLETFEELKRLWTEAVVEASENYAGTTAQKNTAESGVKYSRRYESVKPNEQILEMIEKVHAGTYKDNEKIYLGEVPTNIAKRIYELTKTDVTGFKTVIEARQVSHIIKDHGDSGDTDQSMKDPNDIAKIEYALKEPDDISESGKTQAYSYMENGRNKTANTVLYEKRIGDKSYYVVQAVPDTKAKTVYIVTAFIGKSGYKKEASQLINANRLDVTSKNGSVNTSTHIIRDTDVSVKRKNSLKDGESVKKAEEYFGTTYKVNEAGYLLTDGKMLDFSGRHEGASGGYRTVDHRDIIDAMEDDYGGDTYTSGMIRFMQEGNIRLSPESGGINLSVKPNKNQLAALDRYISHFRGEVILDIDDANGNTIASIEYPKRTYSKRIIDDINNYFDNGVIPEQLSGLGEFRYSFKDTIPDRTLLVGALENATRSEDEAATLQEYKKQISEMDEVQEKLLKLRAEIRKQSFAKGKRDMQALNKMRAEANELSSRIDEYDKKLLELEAFEELKRLWTEAVVEASENYAGVKNPFDNTLQNTEKGATMDATEVKKQFSRKDKRVKYIPYNKIGKDNIEYIRQNLRAMYRGLDDAIADGIAIAKGKEVYIVDSGKENGEISFGVRRKRIISDVNAREEFIRRQNDDGLSNGYISNGLSRKLGSDSFRGVGRDLRRESEEELRTNQKETEHQQIGLLQDNGNRGGVKHSYKDLDARDLTPEQQALLAGLMTQGRRDAKMIRTREERMAYDREARARGVESRAKTEMRGKIKRKIGKNVYLAFFTNKNAAQK